MLYFTFLNKIIKYLQMAWAETSTIGCGYVMFSELTAPTKGNKLIFCNYGVA
jgi:hypothetical protein